MHDIIVTGSIAYDYLMRFPGQFREHILRDKLDQVSLSFLVDDMTRHYGGVAANIVYTLGRLGLRPRLFGTVGKDFGDYRHHLEAVGVDTTLVVQIDSVFTASFFANTDLENNQIASFYSGAMALARNYRLSDVYESKPDLVVISPNDPIAMQSLAQECRERGIRFLYDPSQQVPRLTGSELRQGMSGAFAMVVNQYEADMICEKTGMTLSDLRREIDVLVITRGKHGSSVYMNDDVVDVPIVPAGQIVDPTGVGDAFRAGLLCGISHGWDWKLAGEIGALCACYVLEQVGTQNHVFTVPEFIARFRANFDDQNRLDALLKNQTIQEKL
ncbi:MAG: carbohydrate kinase family protein [Anaerolineae bacterium]|nr:carbohydrate kinase family protein [Anaerolineae bacterium]